MHPITRLFLSDMKETGTSVNKSWSADLTVLSELKSRCWSVSVWRVGVGVGRNIFPTINGVPLHSFP